MTIIVNDPRDYKLLDFFGGQGIQDSLDKHYCAPFIDAQLTKTNLENSSGYSITKVDADSYTFSVSTDTATTGNIRGGGGRATAGPATIEN